MMRYGLGGFGMLAGGLFAALIAAVLAALVVLAIIMLVRHSRHSNGQMHEHMMPRSIDNNALRILDERFAKGEIDEEEYTKKKEILKK